MSNEQHPDPADFRKSAALATGASASDLFAALQNFDANVISRDAAISIARPQPPTQDPTAMVTSADLPMQPMPLDTGFQQPIDQSGAPGVGVVCTGILNGAPASATVLTTGDLAPIM